MDNPPNAPTSQQQPRNPQEGKIEHPPVNYQVTELYTIRKQSLSYSNDQIRKRLLKIFQKYSKIKNENKDKDKDPSRQYDPQYSQIRREFKRFHEIYKTGSKTDEITLQKRQKMRDMVQRIEKMTKKDEMVLASNIDLSKAYIRSSGSSHGAQGQRIFSSRTPHTM